MKKTLLIIVALFILCGNANAFERLEPTLPISSEPLSKLETATGWMKAPGDRWISRENRIPEYL